MGMTVNHYFLCRSIDYVLSSTRRCSFTAFHSSSPFTSHLWSQSVFTFLTVIVCISYLFYWWAQGGCLKLRGELKLWFICPLSSSDESGRRRLKKSVRYVPFCNLVSYVVVSIFCALALCGVRVSPQATRPWPAGFKVECRCLACYIPFPNANNRNKTSATRSSS